jgi:Xaa-Pro aminopeptidase
MLPQPGIDNLTPAAEIAARLAGLRRLMAESEIDFCVIMQHADLFYFTGSVQKATLVVSQEQDPLYFVQRSVQRARMETALPLIEVRTDRQIGDVLKEKGVLKGKGGMELDVVPVAVFQRFSRIIGFDAFTDVSGLIKELRIVKSPFELEQVRQSGAICDAVFAHAPTVIREGVREVDIDAALVAVGRRQGHQGFLRMRGFNQEMMNLYVTSGCTGTIGSNADVPISGLGVTAALAQGSSTKTVEKGIPVLVDYSGGYNGYITDETRVYAVGRLDETFLKAYETAREIIEDTEAFGKEGVNATDVFARAYEKVRRAGLEANFMGFGADKVSFVGHGLGLEINEPPVFTARHGTILKAGTVFAYEPKFIFPGKGAIGIEVDFITRKEKLERVTKTPIDIVQV